MDEQNLNEVAPAPAIAAPSGNLTPVGELFKKSWEQYKTNFNALVPIVLLAGIGLYLGFIFAVATGHHEIGAQIGNDVKNGWVGGSAGILGLVAALIYIVGMIWAVPTLINRIDKMSQPMSVKQAFSEGKKWIAPVIVAGILAGVLTVIGFILVVIPGIIVAVWLSFTSFIVVLENKRGADALKASKEYVKGYWWPVFGRLVLIGIVLAVISGVIGWIIGLILGKDFGGFVNSLVSLILIPLAVIYEYNLFKNLKSVKGQIA